MVVPSDEARQFLEEKMNPDPTAKLGEVQCCKTDGTCTRRSPWNSNSNNDCISGDNDDRKYSLQEAANSCAGLGEAWSLCTRQQVEAGICQGKGCQIDHEYTWVIDNERVIDNEDTDAPATEAPATEAPTNSDVVASVPAYFALIDGAPGNGNFLEERMNPDPEAKLGEVQCCKTDGTCTRKDSNNVCISGNNDDTKYSLQEAANMCAALGETWSLCTRQQVENKNCKNTR